MFVSDKRSVFYIFKATFDECYISNVRIPSVTYMVLRNIQTASWRDYLKLDLKTSYGL